MVRLIAAFTEREVERFWSKVAKSTEDSCWNFIGGNFIRGYGIFYLREGHQYIASRVAWFVTHGQPDVTLDVCHKCDNRACCNPAHLFLGTRKENMQDAKRKGRVATGDKRAPKNHARGEDYCNSKLTEDGVREIRRLASEGSLSIRAIGRRYGVTHELIRNVVARRTWSHV